mmetsp:Transcript_22184/g.62119  ORF Transcript_22184/g.62119 Transcript_22184/m.62119 type:complete len:231 (-) Transcript_22184:773-1465(-)
MVIGLRRSLGLQGHLPLRWRQYRKDVLQRYGSLPRCRGDNRPLHLRLAGARRGLLAGAESDLQSEGCRAALWLLRFRLHRCRARSASADGPGSAAGRGSDERPLRAGAADRRPVLVADQCVQHLIEFDEEDATRVGHEHHQLVFPVDLLCDPDAPTDLQHGLLGCGSRPGSGRHDVAHHYGALHQVCEAAGLRVAPAAGRGAGLPRWRFQALSVGIYTERLGRLVGVVGL